MLRWCQNSTKQNSISSSATHRLRGFGLVCRRWGPLTLWNFGPGSLSGTLPGLVGPPGWRGGGMLQWVGSVCHWKHHRSSRLFHESAFFWCYSPEVGSRKLLPLPPARRCPLLYAPPIIPGFIPYYADNTLCMWSWSPSVSLGQSLQSMPPGQPPCFWSPSHCGCVSTWGITPGSAVSGVVVALCVGDPPPRDFLVGWSTWKSSQDPWKNDPYQPV